MATISPVSDLRDYNKVLNKVNYGTPVYLTVNGRGKYTIRDIEEDEEFEKTKAMIKLMCELNKGRMSGEKEGYISALEAREMTRRNRA
ncbi:MAG: type II toxin-antitoxin system prevent-host-death family antitoxin [Lachnospiraceae bacterium]|nr:type II toxin-antitoxin system prevent-host-death family antitoxin [Lachnospiraceae bacterium]